MTYRTSMAANAPAGTNRAARETVGGAVALARQSADHSAAALRNAAFAAYTDGITTAALVGAILTASLAAALAVRHRKS